MVPIIGIHLYLASFAGGNTDSFYRRFTSPQQSNLILGNSRAAQGVRPEFLHATNGEKFYNYSFTIFDSPYGEAYFKSIEKKLDELENRGMIDMMIHQYERYKLVTHFTLSKAIWQSWIRR